MENEPEFQACYQELFRAPFVPIIYLVYLPLQLPYASTQLVKPKLIQRLKHHQRQLATSPAYSS